MGERARAGCRAMPRHCTIASHPASARRPSSAGRAIRDAAPGHAHRQGPVRHGRLQRLPAARQRSA
jgi:hypothetical protein